MNAFIMAPRMYARPGTEADLLGLYGTPKLGTPPADEPERFYRLRDNAAWMRVA